MRSSGAYYCHLLYLMSTNTRTPPTQGALTDKDEALARAHEDLKERITLLRRVQDLEMDNADLKQVMQKFDQAQVSKERRGVWMGWCGMMGI